MCVYVFIDDALALWYSYHREYARHYGRFRSSVIITGEILNASAGYCPLDRADKNFHANYRRLRPLLAASSRLLLIRESHDLRLLLELKRHQVHTRCFKLRYWS